MAMTDNIFRELAKNSLMLISLHGVRTVLERELGIKDLQITMDETAKAEIERAAKQKSVAYPYAYMSMSELTGVRDQSNNKYAQRYGTRMQAGGDGQSTRATSRKAFMFPINVGLDLKYIHDDPTQAMLMAEAFVILSMIGGVTFNIDLGGGVNFDVRIEIPESVTIPIASINAPEAPGGFEVSMSLIIHTFSGFFKEVAAVNNDHATLNVEIMLEDGEKIQTEL